MRTFCIGFALLLFVHVRAVSVDFLAGLVYLCFVPSQWNESMETQTTTGRVLLVVLVLLSFALFVRAVRSALVQKIGIITRVVSRPLFSLLCPCVFVQ